MAAARRGREHAEADRKFLIGLSRAFGGAVFFSLPLLMTMEMWQLGFYLDRFRVVLFVVLILPLLVVLDRFSGFMEADTWLEDAVDGIIAFGVGTVAAVVILSVFSVITVAMPLREITGKVALQAIPGSFGAVLANSQFNADRPERKREEGVRRRGGYVAELMFMVVGAVFLAFNIAPTEEVVLLASALTPLNALVLLALTLGMMHAFVYASGFRGTPKHSPDTSAWQLFAGFTTVGYALALLVSAYVLWTFGRFEGNPLGANVIQVVVLGLPAGLGAAAARLVL